MSAAAPDPRVAPRLGLAGDGPLAAPGSGSAGDGPRAVLIVDAAESVGFEAVTQLRADGYAAVHARSAQHARVLAAGRPIRAVVLGELDSRGEALVLLDEIRNAATRNAATRNAVTRNAATRNAATWAAATQDDPAQDTDAWIETWDADLPVIVLGPRGEQLDMLRAFEAGADDFMSHPPSYLELRARLRAVLRRAERIEPSRLQRIGSLLIDTDAHMVAVAGTLVRLSPLEYELLTHLALRPAAVVARQELLRSIWGHGTRVDTRTVDRHASSLRRKLTAAGAAGMVVTVWGVGYRLT